ncbi:polysaccharide biosynthesis/export family protein [Oscillatoria sp. CS-180]|uniref:polysaccharide biosynthesis/export family protein n=1 Tax=Oscillatoria sp. CS-180 TaxID=3021720 RepID=UPI00232BEE32|nr:polysaccharide biosynthesis/export family protein [Oscillatoria sp. CS-180]MDB9524432.1 polysaccharide biosynthesis/export family protein [Oscillatoria sp. CS-180]
MSLSKNYTIFRWLSFTLLPLSSAVLISPAVADSTEMTVKEATPTQLQMADAHIEDEDSELISPLPAASETPDPPPGEENDSEEMEDDSEEMEDDLADEVFETLPPPPEEPVFFDETLDSTVPFSDLNTGLTGYLLGPGDQLDVSVIGVTDLERNRIVLPDGTILLPLVGAVTAAGRTLEDLEADITRRFSFYLVEPVVEVSLNTLRPVVVTVGGEVNRPGPVQLNSLSTFNTRVDNNAQLTSASTAPTLSTALVGAGGVLRTADLRDIKVQRQLPDGRDVTLEVNLWESIFEGGGDSNVLLQDGDIVFVPEAPPAAIDINPQVVARSSLAPESVNVRVIGEVVRPGDVEVPTDGTVSTALAIAGGYDIDTADLSTVALLRLQDNGQVEEQIIDMNSNLVDGTPIQDGDIIVVPKRGYLNTLDTIGRTLSPLTAPFNFILLLERIFGGG